MNDTFPMTSVPHPARYEVRRADSGDYILWDTFTQTVVEFAGPYKSSSDATTHCRWHNKAYETISPRTISNVR